MSSVALVTASTSSLPRDVIERYDIHLIPFVIQFLDGNYREGDELGLSAFYRQLEKADAVPTTAPTSTAQYIQFFSHEFPEADTIMMFHVSATMSKSFENAQQAAQRITHRRIINIDTHSFTMGSGLQIIEVAQALENGASVDEAVELAEILSQHTFAGAFPESVRYLRMSGRLGRLPAMAASLMGIIPILGKTSEGIDVLSKTRSQEAARQKLIDHAQEFIGSAAPLSIGVSHTNAPERAQELSSIMKDLYPDIPIYLADAGPILAVHVGPNALGLAVIRDHA